MGLGAGQIQFPGSRLSYNFICYNTFYNFTYSHNDGVGTNAESDEELKQTIVSHLEDQILELNPSVISW